MPGKCVPSEFAQGRQWVSREGNFGPFCTQTGSPGAFGGWQGGLLGFSFWRVHLLGLCLTSTTNECGMFSETQLSFGGVCHCIRKRQAGGTKWNSALSRPWRECDMVHLTVYPSSTGSCSTQSSDQMNLAEFEHVDPAHICCFGLALPPRASPFFLPCMCCVLPICRTWLSSCLKG